MVGVVDEPKQKNQRYSYDSKNAVCYFGHSGYKHPSGGYEGGGFSEGQTIETTVDLANKTIKWSVGGKTRATYIL